MFTLTACENTLFIYFSNFSVMNTDSLVALALETCTTNSPDVDAIFQQWK